jgi:hypothetical protein
MSLSRELEFAQNTYLFKYQVFYLEYMPRSTLTFYNADQWRDKLFIRYTAIPEGTGILWGVCS